MIGYISMKEPPLTFSFDFDGCLDSNSAVQEILRMAQSCGKRIYILTSRSPEVYRNQDLFRVAEALNVSREQILFAFEHTKSELIQAHGIDLHVDNDPHVVHQINSECGAHKAMLVHYHYISQDLTDS